MLLSVIPVMSLMPVLSYSDVSDVGAKLLLSVIPVMSLMPVTGVTDVSDSSDVIDASANLLMSAMSFTLFPSSCFSSQQTISCLLSLSVL